MGAVHCENVAGSDGAKVMQMEAYWTLRDEIINYEQAILRAMAFDIEPTRAYSFLLEFAWLLKCGDAEQGVVQVAWTLLNDSFCSEACVVHSPPRLALACLLLAAEFGQRVPHLKAQARHLADKIDVLCRQPHLEDFLGLGPMSGGDELEEI